MSDICPFCLGTGLVSTYESVYPGEPHQAPIGERPCVCQEDVEDRDEYDPTE